MESTKSRVFITGGTGSVGQSLIKVFSNNGYSVVFQYHSNTATADSISKQYGAEAIQIDLSQDFQLLDNKFDVVVNNAGINITDASSHEVQMSDWNKTIAVNLSAVFAISKFCLPYMIERKKGRIINISSIYSLRAVEGNLPYTVSKHGLTGITKTIAKEYAHLGITCNEICPGPIESELMIRISEREAQVTNTSSKAYLEEVRQAIPAKRMAYPDEIADLALYLASTKSDYINGISIPIDGGMIIT
jgi:NAD(P)-dependent dehydrogenase (short-subunit alcohol dehydrogenase family)